MTVKVLIPTPLQKFTNNQATIECGGDNISELIESLETNCPGIKKACATKRENPADFSTSTSTAKTSAFWMAPKQPSKMAMKSVLFQQLLVVDEF